MIKVELTKSRSPERKYRMRIDNKIFYQDEGSFPRLENDSSTPESIHFYVRGSVITRKIAEQTFNEIPREISSRQWNFNKDATTRAQNLTIGMLNGEVLLTSMKEITPNPEDKEHVTPGIVSLSTDKERESSLISARFSEG